MKKTAIVAVSTVAVLYFLAVAVLACLPHLDWGIGVSLRDGTVNYVNPGAATLGIAPGDRLTEPLRGDAAVAFDLRSPQPGEAVRVATGHGVVTLHAHTVRRSVPYAIVTCVALLAGVTLIVFTTLLFLRRPGIMALALWIYAITSAQSGDLSLGLDWVPANVTLWVWLAMYGFNSGAWAVPLIPFALRFPDGKLDRRLRWADAAAWAAFAGAFFLFAYLEWTYLNGGIDTPSYVWVNDILPGLPLPLAALILIVHYVRTTPSGRAKTAWAIAGFVGSFIASSAGQSLDALGVLGADTRVPDRVADAIGNLFPLLAIYPILRYQLFDLGFFVNRATLYSTLTLAAIGTLAGVNWLAQHVISERFALVLQPVAAIVIGLGFVRVRAWTQGVIERLLFRDRFAAEREVADMMRGFALAERPEVLDHAVAVDAAHALQLQSAALFRASGSRLVRVCATGWDEATLAEIASDDMLVERLLAAEAPVRLDRPAWGAAGLPGAPRTPVVAVALTSAAGVRGVALYGRHTNGTEIDPEELTLLRDVCDAAATAYETVELRAELQAARAQLAAVR
jgi:hypothetical protein